MLEMLLPLAAAVAPAPGDARAQISAAMAASAAAWNAGKLDGFIAVYAPDATYVGRDGLVQGRAAIAERYRPSFADGGNTRGRLSFSPRGWRHISATHELLFASWRLSGGAEDAAGMTTLLFERRPEGWRIIADHSS